MPCQWTAGSCSKTNKQKNLFQSIPLSQYVICSDKLEGQFPSNHCFLSPLLLLSIVRTFQGMMNTASHHTAVQGRFICDIPSLPSQNNNKIYLIFLLSQCFGKAKCLRINNSYLIAVGYCCGIHKVPDTKITSICFRKYSFKKKTPTYLYFCFQLLKPKISLINWLLLPRSKLNGNWDSLLPKKCGEKYYCPSNEAAHQLHQQLQFYPQRHTR